MKKVRFVASLIALGLLAQPLASMALTLPAASGGETIYNLSQTTFGTLTYYVCPSCSATALPGSASATNAGIGASVDAMSEYFFAVVGPSTPAAVMVDVTATTSATASGGGEGQAEVYAANTELVSYACAGTCSPTGPLTSDAFFVHVNTPVEILMTASAQDGPSSANADPYIAIDPSTANASLYSIQVSSGISNVAPVPLTSTVSLLGLGLAALAWVGGLVRRRIPAVDFVSPGVHAV